MNDSHLEAFSIDIAKLTEAVLNTCIYCNKDDIVTDIIIFNEKNILDSTIVNDVYQNGKGGYGEFFILHRSPQAHIRIYLYFILEGTKSYYARPMYIDPDYIVNYPDTAKMGVCKNCNLTNLTINAFCNQCGNDIYEELDYGPLF